MVCLEALLWDFLGDYREFRVLPWELGCLMRIKLNVFLSYPQVSSPHGKEELTCCSECLLGRGTDNVRVVVP